jgi:hypothetical protein
MFKLKLIVTCLEVVKSFFRKSLELSDEADAGVGKEKTSGFDLEEGQFKILKVN